MSSLENINDCAAVSIKVFTLKKKPFAVQGAEPETSFTLLLCSLWVKLTLCYWSSGLCIYQAVAIPPICDPLNFMNQRDAEGECIIFPC